MTMDFKVLSPCSYIRISGTYVTVRQQTRWCSKNVLMLRSMCRRRKWKSGSDTNYYHLSIVHTKTCGSYHDLSDIKINTLASNSIANKQEENMHVYLTPQQIMPISSILILRSFLFFSSSPSLHGLHKMPFSSSFVQLYIFLGRQTSLLPRALYVYTISVLLSLFVLVGYCLQFFLVSSVLSITL